MQRQIPPYLKIASGALSLTLLIQVLICSVLVFSSIAASEEVKTAEADHPEGLTEVSTAFLLFPPAMLSEESDEEPSDEDSQERPTVQDFVGHHPVSTLRGDEGNSQKTAKERPLYLVFCSIKIPFPAKA